MRPEQPSLASVGSGMSAGAAFGQRRVRDVRAVQTSFNQMSRECPNDSCNSQHAVRKLNFYRIAPSLTVTSD